MSAIAESRPIEILLVEDNPGDVRLTREALAAGKIRNHLSVASDGVEALAFLRHQSGFETSARPDLILLDLNLPKKSGREVLEDLKDDPDLRCIPVVVLTTSGSEEDILATYNLHANCYVKKPVDLDQFFGVIRAVDQFWLTVVKLPTDQAP